MDRPFAKTFYHDVASSRCLKGKRYCRVCCTKRASNMNVFLVALLWKSQLRTTICVVISDRSILDGK